MLHDYPPKFTRRELSLKSYPAEKLASPLFTIGKSTAVLDLTRQTGNDLKDQQPLTLILAEKKTPAVEYLHNLISSPPAVAGSSSAE